MELAFYIMELVGALVVIGKQGWVSQGGVLATNC